eukprot:CAMPEP_0172059172 /NCGR_PEP_ID=MMETSP1043-20130122/7275_1 /TAXON_ID=464988 /ORGANISM="Hemiselmis andersenii, Strain CCMP441" /LENGTH=214 /DNA_ID=CAMNT_0012718825 /DNA_START=698 /DNA_END=1339 /DNA_ORIENTATION=+
MGSKWAVLLIMVLILPIASAFLSTSPAGARVAAFGRPPAAVAPLGLGRCASLVWVAASRDRGSKPRGPSSPRPPPSRPSDGVSEAWERYGGRVTHISTAKEWFDLLDASVVAGGLLIAEFRSMTCRKCKAVEQKFKKFPATYVDRNVFFAEVDAKAIGSALREALGVDKVPYVTAWKDAAMVDDYVCGSDIGACLRSAVRMLDEHAPPKGAAPP